MPLEIIFSKLIDLVGKEGIETKRTLIYYQTRRQCGVLYRMFELTLKDKFYNGIQKPHNRLVGMYHAGTPESVKGHVINDFGNVKGRIRILMSTIAFGMGVTCHRICAASDSFWTIKKSTIICSGKWMCRERWKPQSMHNFIQWFSFQPLHARHEKISKK